MNFKRRISTGEVGFQMGPMLDIIFILLIQFMVATMFANREDWFQITVPKAKNGKEQPNKTEELVLNMQQDGTLYLFRGAHDGKQAGQGDERLLSAEDWTPESDVAREDSFRRLEAVLRNYRETNGANLKVVIRADGLAHHGKIVKLLDVCRGLEIKNVAFATRGRREGKQ